MTPLQRYLNKHKKTQEEFAHELSRWRGYAVYQPHVSVWCSGKRLPSRATQEQISQATLGAVTPRMWTLYKARNK